MKQCDNVADTSLVGVTLTDATDDLVEVSEICYRYLFISLNSYFAIVLAGVGRRCSSCADNSGAPLLKYQPSTLLNHIEGLLQCQEDLRSSL